MQTLLHIATERYFGKANKMHIGNNIYTFNDMQPKLSTSYFFSVSFGFISSILFEYF